MRHFCLRAQRTLIISAFLLVAQRQECLATPVFKRVDSRFSSGEYAREWLEDHVEAVQTQKWYQVATIDGRRGWIAEGHLLTALNFVSEAIVTEDAPSRSSPSLDAVSSNRVLKKATSVLVLELDGSWARTQPLPASENQEAWIPTEVLKAKIDGDGARVFVHTGSPLKVMPGVHARALEFVAEQTFVELVSAKKDWLEVRTRTGSGFIERRNVWSVRDLAAGSARPALTQTPLRAEPSPLAPIKETLGLGTKLALQASKIVKWGRVRISSMGPMWWPILEAEPSEAPTPTTSETVKSEELFKRKIFDMAASSLVPSLKFISADGIYRTLDNRTWTKIPIFKNENHPIAISKNGSIFIGPYRSDDNGETFQQWIRWDGFVSALRRDRIRSDKTRLAEIRPDDNEGRRVTLRLMTTDGQSVRLRTHDGGRDWARY